MDALGILRIRLLCTKDDTPKAEEAPSARAARFGRTSSGCPFLHACVQRLVQALLVALLGVHSALGAELVVQTAAAHRRWAVAGGAAGLGAARCGVAARLPSARRC